MSPEFPGLPGYGRWSIPDPAAGGSAGQAYPRFQQTAAGLEARTGHLLAGRASPLVSGAP